MKKLLLALLFLFPSSGFAAQAYCTPKVVAGGQVTGTQTSKPWLLKLDDARYKTVGNGGYVEDAQGDDLRPYSDTGTTALTYQKVSYDGTNGRAQIWVQVPSLATSTTIYVCYGDAALTSDGSSTSTWPSQYKAVLHLEDGSSLSLAESTSNALSFSNNMGVTATAGTIGGGANFDGASQWLYTADNAVFNGSAYTWSVWLKDEDETTQETVMSKGLYGTSWSYSIQTYTSNDIIVLIADSEGDGGSNYVLTTSHALPASAWTLLTVVFDGSQSTNETKVKIYYDGVLQSSTSGGTIATSLVNSTDDFSVGQFFGLGRYYIDDLDEVELTNDAWTANYIAAYYNNTFANETFWPDGTEAAVGGGNPVLVAKAIGGSSDSGLTADTASVTTTGANLCVYTWIEALVPGTLSDSKSNTGFVELTAYTSTTVGTFRVRTAYKINPTVGSGHSAHITAGGSTIYPTVAMYCYTVDDPTGTFDAQNGGSSAMNNVTSYQIPSVTPATSTGFCLTSLSNDVATTGPSINSSYVDGSTQAFSSGNNFPFYVYDKILASGAQAPTYSWTNAAEGTGQTACFRNTPAASASTNHGPLMGIIGR